MDLREKIEYELATRVWYPDQSWSRRTAHDKHNYDGTCAICKGDTERIADAVMVPVSAHVDTMAATIEQQRQRIKELEGENQRMREEVRLKSRAAYLNGINVCMNRLRGQTDVSAVLPALIASRDRAVELHNAALDRARENGDTT